MAYSFKEYLPEDVHNRWSKHVGSYADHNIVTLHICTCTFCLFLINHQCMVMNHLKWTWHVHYMLQFYCANDIFVVPSCNNSQRVWWRQTRDLGSHAFPDTARSPNNCCTIKHLFSYTKQVHDIYPLHIFIVLLLLVSVLLAPSSGWTVCLLLKTASCYAAIICGFYNRYVINTCTFHIYDITVVATINSSCMTAVVLSNGHKVLPDDDVSNTETCSRNTVNICNE